MSDSSPFVPEYPAALLPIERRLDPYPWFRYMRREEPVRYDENRDCWDVFRHEDVRCILRHSEEFGTNPVRASPILMRFLSKVYKYIKPADFPFIADTMLSATGSEHERLRSFATSYFTPDELAVYEPYITARAHEHLDKALDRDPVDLIADYASPLTVDVISELIGIPEADRDIVHGWARPFIEAPVDQEGETVTSIRERQKDAQTRMMEYMDDLIARRREDPSDGMVSQVVSSPADDRLSHRELRAFFMFLLFAGHLTTRGLIGSAIRIFDENPSVLADVRDGTHDIEAVIEEVLRYRPPQNAVFRYAIKPTKLGGKTIQKGDEIVGWIGSANRDEEVFDEPDTFRPNRRTGKHIAFGDGEHKCLGAPLAKIESRIALNVLFDRIGNIDVHESDVVPTPSAFIYGIDHLPVTVEPQEETEE